MMAIQRKRPTTKNKPWEHAYARPPAHQPGRACPGWSVGQVGTLGCWVRLDHRAGPGRNTGLHITRSVAGPARQPENTYLKHTRPHGTMKQVKS